MNDKLVLTVCNEVLITLGLREVLGRQAGFTLCGEAACAAQAMETCARVRPRLVVVAGLQDEGLALIKWLHRSRPGLPVLIIGRGEDSQAVQRAVRAGARGYVTSAADVNELLLAVKAVESGSLYVSHHAANGLLLHLNGREDGLKALSDREMEIFRLMGRGLGGKEIAARLNISVKTVDTHRQRMKDKLCLRTGAELSRLALRDAVAEV